MINVPIIALLTTSRRERAIGVIRLSLGDSSDNYRKYNYFITGRVKLFPRMATVVNIIINNKVIDKGLVILFPKYKSYTGECVLEYYLHGNRFNLKLIIKQFLKFFKYDGLRLAFNGEFTERAYRNKRVSMDEVRKIDSYYNNDRVSELIYNIVIEISMVIEKRLIVNSDISYLKLINYRRRLVELFNYWCIKVIIIGCYNDYNLIIKRMIASYLYLFKYIRVKDVVIIDNVNIIDYNKLSTVVIMIVNDYYMVNSTLGDYIVIKVMIVEYIGYIKIVVNSEVVIVNINYGGVKVIGLMLLNYILKINDSIRLINGREVELIVKLIDIINLLMIGDNDYLLLVNRLNDICPLVVKDYINKDYKIFKGLCLGK